MLENASRQLFLVLLSIAAGLLCCIFKKPVLGHDLKGGTQLRYEIPEDVLKTLVTKEGLSIEKIMEQTIAVIAERIDPAGTLDPLITRSGESGILIELPFFETEAAKREVLARIANIGKLEMRIVATDGVQDGGLSFNLKAEQEKLKAWLADPENKARIQEDARNIRAFNEAGPGIGPIAAPNLGWYPRKITPDLKNPNNWDGTYTSPLYQQLSPATVKAFEDSEYNNGIIPEAFAKKEPKDRFLVEFVAINLKEKHFTGEDLDPSGVGAGPSRNGGLGVLYKIVENKSGDYADWSERWIKKASAIVLNGYVRSAPTFQSKIPGNGIIEGQFTAPEIDELVKVLRTGSLRVEPELLSNESIGATLGGLAIERGAYSLIAGTVLIFGFMLLYYRVAGTIACITLVLNVFLLWAAMLFMEATITLPGLGGIVLTMGMAVDANVLIYERFREELAKGKELLQAVRAGFDRAMSAILDSNITTFLAGLVLYNIGVGPVRGFAVTLMVGIVTTVFTQFFVTRLLFHVALEKNWLVAYKPRSWFTSIRIDYVRYMKPALLASALLIGGGLAYTMFVAPREVTLGIDFTGGANMRIALAEPVTKDAFEKSLSADAAWNSAYPNVQVNTYGDSDATAGAREFNLRIKLNDKQRDEVAAARRAHRDAVRKAAEAKAEPPADFEPSYVAELRRVFADKLVKAGIGKPQLTAYPGARENLAAAVVKVQLTQPVEIAKARETLAKGLSGLDILPQDNPAATTSANLQFEWTTQATTKAWEVPGILQKEIAKLKDKDGKAVSLTDPFPDANEIQGRLVSDLRNAAIGAIVLSWLLIMLYLRVRFHEYKYGIAAVVALVHDVLVALVVAVFVNHQEWVSAEINLAMIACFLTIIGYSVNDTIVIFDRIREEAQENVRTGRTEAFKDLINRALNQTMSRTLLTSGLTLLVVIAQFVVNYRSGSDLEAFAFTMMVGMVSGVYSTIFIAAPILIWLDKGDLSRPELQQAPHDPVAEAIKAQEAEAAAAAAAAKANSPAS
ncbi:MAG: protein translocase subunit SecD [Planctomycetes bacterium]|nr:protein translocase subunit SecD [Planctomycetota bacterium]